MKRNRLGYYINEGINSIFKHGFMSFASVCIIIACLLIMGSFSLLALNVDAIIDTLESENQIVAYVDESLSDSEARALQSELEANSNVEEVVFTSKEEAMDSFVEQHQNSSLLENLDASVLRDRYIIYLKDIALMAKTQEELLSIDGISKVNIHLEIARGFVTVRNVVSAVSIILVIILLIVSLFIMTNTIKLTTFERREEIAIMRMVGATKGFIKWPFVIEGLFLGTFGSLAAYIAQWGIYSLVADNILERSGINFLEAIPFSEVAIPLLILFLILGLGVGIIGSLVAIKNYLKV